MTRFEDDAAELSTDPLQRCWLGRDAGMASGRTATWIVFNASTVDTGGQRSVGTRNGPRP